MKKFIFAMLISLFPLANYAATQNNVTFNFDLTGIHDALHLFFAYQGYCDNGKYIVIGSQSILNNNMVTLDKCNGGAKLDSSIFKGATSPPYSFIRNKDPGGFCHATKPLCTLNQDFTPGTYKVVLFPTEINDECLITYLGCSITKIT